METNPIAPYSFSAISAAVGAIASLAPAFFIYKSYKKKPEDELLRNFFLYFLIFGIANTILAVTEFIFPTDTVKLALLLIFVLPAYYLALAFFFLIPSSLKFPKLKEAGFSLIIFLGIVSLVLNLMDIRPVTIDERGLISYEGASITDELFLLAFMIAWLPAIIIFIYEAIRNKERIIRVRSILMSVGLLALLISGGMHDAVRSWQAFLLADVAVIVSYFILMFGVLYHGKRTTNESYQKKTDN